MLASVLVKLGFLIEGCVGIPWWLNDKKSTFISGDLGSIPGLGRSPGGRKWQSTAVFLPEKSHGQRSLAGYSLWGHKESDTTELLSTHTPTKVPNGSIEPRKEPQC